MLILKCGIIFKSNVVQIGAYNSRGGEEHTYVLTSKNLNVHVTTAVN